MNTELFELYKIDYLKDFKKYLNFFNDIEEYNFDIEETLPIHKQEDYRCSLKENISVVEEYDKRNNYKEKIIKYNKLFSSLKSSFIDLLAFKAFKEIETNESILNTLKSFKPYNKKTNIIEYAKYSNVSGRLVVKKGPRILTLPSRHRSILKSRFENGNLYSIDFSALEPRITANLSGTESGNDIYEDILNLLSYDADRSVIKKAVISSIYGANYTSLENLSTSKSKELFEIINSYFDFKKILDMSQNID